MNVTFSKQVSAAGLRQFCDCESNEKLSGIAASYEVVKMP